MAAQFTNVKNQIIVGITDGHSDDGNGGIDGVV